MCLQTILQKYFHKKKKSAQQLDLELPSDDLSSFSLEGSLLPIKSSSLPGSTASESPRIIIIGAGAAGLACASKLIEFGFENILLLEAENRIGGRIHTQMFADNVIDLGAQWVHGEVSNIVYDMVHERGWLDTSGEIYKTYECIRSNGQVVSAALIERLKGILRGIFENSVEDLAAYEGSFGDYLNDRFAAALQQPSASDIDGVVAAEFFENFKRIESSETASGVEEVSAKGFHEYWQCPGDYLLNWRDKGYVRFLHMLMGTSDERIFGDLEEHLRFDCKVDHIQWDRADHKAVVRCDKGLREYEADHVVITVSLGVLKDRVDSMFHPPLPVPKKRAIVGLGYGSVGKIYLEFAQKFWPDNWYGFTTLWLSEDLAELHKSAYAWVEEVFGFYCVSYQPRVLVAWLVGTYVATVEKMPIEQVEAGCLYLLRRFLGRWEIPDPVNVLVTGWQNNTNFAGAYSFRSMLSEELNVSARQLAQPITVMVRENASASASTSSGTMGNARENVLNARASTSTVSSGTMETKALDNVPSSSSVSAKPILLFAGEATSMHHYSTVHGAVESGYREAHRLINYYNRD